LRARFLPILALLALAACRTKDAPAPVASVTLAEAPAPASLVAELSIGNPKQTWEAARLLGGNLAQALPSSLPVLLATSLSLPPSAAGSLDEAVPMVGVLLSRKDAQEPDFVIGMHVLSGAELVASLTLGNDAKFRRLELGPRLVKLLPAPGAPEFNGALGVSGNYLLLATGVDALRDAGRFVAESVSKRARTEPGLTLRATDKVLSQALAPRLREAWKARRSALSARDLAQRQAKGRAPDFADPEVLLAGVDNTVEAWLGVLESSRELSLSLTPQGDRLRAELLLSPGADGAAALLAHELVVGPVAPLLQLPASTSAALLLRGDAQPSTSAGEGLGASLSKLFGERLSAEQAKRLVGSFDALSKTRRGATSIGLVQGPAPALVVTCELADAAAFPDALADVLSLLELAPISNWLAGTVGKPKLHFAKLPEGVRTVALRLERGAAAPSVPLPKALYMTWQARDGIGYIVVSPDETLKLRPFAEAPRLASSAWLARGQGLADQTALSAFADARLFAPGGPDQAPILLSFGKKAERIAVALDVSTAALPALARLFALDRSP
jgi:hypothetical protein